jgi:hypothetical protein
MRSTPNCRSSLDPTDASPSEPLSLTFGSAAETGVPGRGAPRYSMWFAIPRGCARSGIPARSPVRLSAQIAEATGDPV